RSWRSLMATRAPSSAHRRAVAYPMPVPAAAVTSTVRPASRLWAGPAQSATVDSDTATQLLVDLGDGPAGAPVDGPAVAPAHELPNRAARGVEDRAGGRAVRGEQPGHEGGDVARVVDVEARRVARRGHHVADAGKVLGHAGPGDRGDRVDSDAVTDELLGQDRGQRGDAGLGRAVVGLSDRADQPGGGGDVDHRRVG